MYSVEVIMDDFEVEEEEVVQAPNEVVHLEECPQISLNALCGNNNFQTMRVKGVKGRNSLHILIDSGSTHDFLDIQTAKKLGCAI